LTVRKASGEKGLEEPLKEGRTKTRDRGKGGATRMCHVSGLEGIVSRRNYRGKKRGAEHNQKETRESKTGRR